MLTWSIPLASWSALSASLVVATVGFLLLWSNSRRDVNRVVFSCSLHIALWLAFLHLAFNLHPGLMWLRCACAISTWGPMHFWIIEENIAKAPGERVRWARRGWPWVVVSALLTLICFSTAFIPSVAPGSGRLHGWGYYAYIVGLFSLYGWVLSHSFRMIRRLTGGRRLEMQVWVYGGCAMTLSILVTMALDALTRNRLYIHVQPLLVLTFYAGTAIAITTNRIFDATQIARIVLSRLILGMFVALVALGIFQGLALFLEPPVALLPTVIIALICASMLRSRLDNWFKFYAQDTAARQAAYNVAHDENRVENMEAAFLEILRGWGRSERALIITGAGGKTGGKDDDQTMDERVAAAMRQLRWATPERLIRERSTPNHELMAAFLAEHQLGAAVFCETPMLSVVVGVGHSASHRAFTYPQITQLQELAAIIEGALERTLMVLKIQHTEQLATVGLLGASLAHEIRNPLVSIKAIVQLLPTRYQEEKFREKFFRLISDEVVRIDRLTEQLLDLASPHVYTARPVDLHLLLKSSLELVAPRATDKQVQLIPEFEAAPDKAFTDPAAVTQVLLNLCFNAIQALEVRPRDRWIRIATRNTEGGVELAVTDNGPGITPEMRIRLFKPFNTTKSSGFGLGLTVCRDILASLKAPISIDKPTPGQGATFRVTFPCPP